MSSIRRGRSSRIPLQDAVDTTLDAFNLALGTVKKLHKTVVRNAPKLRGSQATPPPPDIPASDPFAFPLIGMDLGPISRPRPMDESWRHRTLPPGIKILVIDDDAR